MNDLDKNSKTFEAIKHIDEYGVEFWYARELMPVLQYSNWQNFEKIIHKAMISCENSNINVIDHFTDINKMVQIGSGAYREQILVFEILIICEKIYKSRFYTILV